MFHLFQQLGKLTGSVESLHESVRTMHTENKERFVALEDGLREVRHKNANQQHIVINSIEGLRRDVDALTGRVDKIEPPVAKAEAARTWQAARLAALLSAARVVWVFIEPAYHYVVDHLLDLVFPPKH